MVKNGVSIRLRACCKHQNVEMLTQVFQDFFGMGSNTDISIDNSIVDASEWNFNFVSWSN